MSKKRWSVLGLALGTLVLGILVGLMTVGTVAADPSPGVRFQIPRVDVGYAPEYGTGDWSTWIQVQNVSPPDPVTGLEPATGAILFGWRAPSDPPVCPPNDTGPFVAYCQLIQGNAIWTLRSQLHEDIKSAIVYSVPEASFQAACNATAAALNGGTDAWLDWEAAWAADPGEEVAITVNRYGENDHGSFVSSTYTGISEEMDGDGPPYEYFAPYVMKGYNGLDTELTIQNSGTACTSVWIDYLEQGSCSIVYKQHIEQLAPGEAVRLRVPKEVNLFDPNGCYWLGSAHITAEQPLGVIVDETSSTSNVDSPCLGPDPGTLLTHRARARVESRDGEPLVDYKAYADLIFREWSGWSSSIQVQNLSRTGQHTFVTVDFMDNGGDEILFLADWVCPGGSTTFYLPVVANLGFDYVGAAEIESHDQINYPGSETPAQPIFVVVDLKKGDDPFTPGFDPQGGSYNAHPLSQKEWVDEVALPFISKDARAPGDPYTPWTSMIAIRNNSNCNKIKPTIWFKDETGRLLCEISSFWLHPKQLKLIDLENIGCLHAGYIGAAKVLIQPEDVEQLCDLDNDGHVDNLPTLPSVIVVEKGIIGYGGVEDGDITKIYEGVPYSTGDKLCDADLLGTVIDSRTKEPLAGVTITVPDGWADYHELAGRWVYTYTDAVGMTGAAGMYEIEDIITFGTLEPAGTCYTVTVSLDGYQSSVIPDVCLSCGEDKVLNVELWPDQCTIMISGQVIDECTLLPIDGVTIGTGINADAEMRVITDDSTGYYSFSLTKATSTEDITVWAYKDGYSIDAVTLAGVLCDDQVTNFELPPLTSPVEVSGLVVDCDDDSMKPIDGATVTLDELSTETTSAGSYVINGNLVAGTYGITATMAGFFDCTQEVVVGECGADALRDFELDCIAPLTVMVKDDCTGINLQDTTVSVEFDRCCTEDATGTDSDLTDSNGQVVLNASKGTVKVTVEKEGYNTFEDEIDIATCAGRTLDVISLYPKAWVNGQVFSDDAAVIADEGQEDVDVRLVDLDNGDDRLATTDEDGLYDHYNVDPGWYVLRYYVADVAKCESDPFEIFNEDLGSIDRVEATVVLDTCDFTVLGYSCGDLVGWTGRVDTCGGSGLVGATADVYWATSELAAPTAAGYNLTTSASGRVKFDPDPPAPTNDLWYEIQFDKLPGYSDTDADTERRENMNGNTMWFGWPADPCLFLIP